MPSPRRTSAAAPKRRLGRPPATDSAETRRRILETAQKHFADYGYAGATNKLVAEQVGLTTGAIYHYFGSKRDLYASVCESVWTFVLERLQAAVTPEQLLGERIKTIVAVAVGMQGEHPSLARFAVSAADEARRHPDLGDIVTTHLTRLVQFFYDVVESSPDRRALAKDVDTVAIVMLLVAVTEGMTYLAATLPDPAQPAQALTVFERLVDGRLVGDSTGRRGRRQGSRPPR